MRFWLFDTVFPQRSVHLLNPSLENDADFGVGGAESVPIPVVLVVLVVLRGVF